MAGLTEDPRWLAARQARWFGEPRGQVRPVAICPLDWWSPGPPWVRSEVLTVEAGEELRHYQLIVAYRDEDAGTVLGDPFDDQATLAALTARWTAPGESVRAVRGEQTNSSVFIGRRAVVKFYRRLQPGLHPEREILAALSGVGTARLLDRHSAAGYDLAVVQEQFVDASDGWQLAVHAFRHDQDFTDQARELGLSLRHLHTELAKAFATGVANGTAVAEQMCQQLEDAISEVASLAPLDVPLRELFHSLDGRQLPMQRIHGDFHLGQTLRAHGWHIIDFEGEPMRSFQQRRQLDSPLRDVAGMVRSLHYAGYSQLLATHEKAVGWIHQAQEGFLGAYYGLNPDSLVPQVLEAYVADKAVYEVIYEHRHRPDWVAVPLQALRRITGNNSTARPGGTAH